SGRVQYGPTVKAAAVYARGAHFLPFGRAARLLSDLCGASVSTGFVHTVFADAATRLGPFLARLRELLRAVPVLHADETPARVDGGFKYVHVACTDAYTLFHVGGRSAADVDAGGVLPGFTGTIVRDGYAAYRHLTDAEHAWCGVDKPGRHARPAQVGKQPGGPPERQKVRAARVDGRCLDRRPVLHPATDPIRHVGEGHPPTAAGHRHQLVLGDHHRRLGHLEDLPPLPGVLRRVGKVRAT